MKLSQQKLNQLRQRELPIVYNSLEITKSGKIQERQSNLENRIVSGYGVVWGSRNDHGEKFVKGCFTRSIREHGPDAEHPYKIKFRDRHGKSCALFSKLVEDDIGLWFETKPLDEVPWADHLLTQIRSGTINNFSIGFRHVWDRVEWDDSDESLVSLEAKLFEISGVDIPSDIETYATRSAEEIEDLMETVEEFIVTLPRARQLEARTIFTRCMLPAFQQHPEQRHQVQKEASPAGIEMDIDYLISKF